MRPDSLPPRRISPLPTDIPAYAFHPDVRRAATDEHMLRDERSAEKRHVVDIDDIAVGREPCVDLKHEARKRQAQPRVETVAQTPEQAVQRLGPQCPHGVPADARPRHVARAEIGFIQKMRGTWRLQSRASAGMGACFSLREGARP